ncbi:MAG: hypothetical protein WAZ18_02250 [Alphaproteobacteria bacterium]
MPDTAANPQQPSAELREIMQNETHRARALRAKQAEGVALTPAEIAELDELNEAGISFTVKYGNNARA